MGVLSYLKKPSAFLWRAFSPSRESPETGEQDSEEAEETKVRRKGSQGDDGPGEDGTAASPLVVQAWELTAANRQRADRSASLTILPPPMASLPGQSCERPERGSSYIHAVQIADYFTYNYGFKHVIRGWG